MKTSVNCVLVLEVLLEVLVRQLQLCVHSLKMSHCGGIRTPRLVGFHVGYRRETLFVKSIVSSAMNFFVCLEFAM